MPQLLKKVSVNTVTNKVTVCCTLKIRILLLSYWQTSNLATLLVIPLPKSWHLQSPVIYLPTPPQTSTSTKRKEEERYERQEQCQ
jgi:hypothetical protein